jgi:hypothetical protein
MYVKLLSALSICETAPAFFVMKSPYMPRMPFFDDDGDLPVLCIALRGCAKWVEIGSCDAC